MKKILLTLSVATLLLSCGGTVEKTTSDKKDKQVESPPLEDETGKEDDIIKEKADEEQEDKYANMCKETLTSDCYIVSHFSDDDASYITVDFVNYKVIETDSEPEYELVNEIKTLRTFVVGKEYFDCGRVKERSIESLIEKAETDKKTLFNIETDGGVVIELFVRNCAG